MTRAMDDIRKGIPYIPTNPGFYREDGPTDWLRTQEGVWLRSTFLFNARWTLDASRMGPRPFMRPLEPIGFGDLRQYGRVPDGDAGFWFDDRGPILWLRTIEGVWLAADLEAPYWWTLDVNNMPAVDMAHLHAVTLAEAAALNDVTEVEGIDPLDTYDGIAATFGGMNEQGAPRSLSWLRGAPGVSVLNRVNAESAPGRRKRNHRPSCSCSSCLMYFCISGMS